MTDTAKRNMWREKIEQCLTSGMSNRQWCHLNKVNLSTFYYWIAKFKKEEPNLFSAQNTSEWIEITKEALATRVAMVPASKNANTPSRIDGRYDGFAALNTAANTALPVICVRINGVEMTIAPGSTESDIANVFKAARSL